MKIRNLWWLIFLAPAVHAQDSIESKRDVLSLRIENFSAVTFEPASLNNNESIRFIPDGKRPPLKDEPTKTVFDTETGVFLISNLSGVLQIDTTRLQPMDLVVAGASTANGDLPLTPALRIRAKGNSSVRLHYRSDSLTVIALQSSSFSGHGSGSCLVQYFRAGSGSYISNSHTDTVRIQKCNASGMSIIDARKTPVKESFDSVYQSTVHINAQKVCWTILGNSQYSNTRNSKADEPFFSKTDSEKGNKIPLKDIFTNDSVDEHIETYYSDLQKDRNQGKTFYFEDLIFIGKKNRTIPRFRGQWMGFELKLPWWGIPDRAANENWDLDFIKTTAFAWNVFQLSFGFNSSHWGFVTGAGFLWENYVFNYPNTVISKEDHRLNLTLDNSPERKYRKSELGVSYFRVPLLFEYTNAKGVWQSAHVSVGVIPSVLMCSWSKQVYRENGKRHREKKNSDFYVNPFRLDLALYAGWGPFSLFVTYSPLNMFRAGKAPDAIPFGAGIMVGFH